MLPNWLQFLFFNQFSNFQALSKSGQRPVNGICRAVALHPLCKMLYKENKQKILSLFTSQQDIALEIQ
jgi:hypothetical protein